MIFWTYSVVRLIQFTEANTPNLNGNLVSGVGGNLTAWISVVTLTWLAQAKVKHGLSAVNLIKVKTVISCRAKLENAYSKKTRKKHSIFSWGKSNLKKI